MTNNRNRHLDESVFFGRLGASMGHDLQNVFAIIKENAGLMQDIMAMVRSAGAEIPMAEKFGQRITKIREQVDRGAAMAICMNRFSHIPDTRPAHVDVEEALRLFVGMTGRLARINRIAMAVEAENVLPGVDLCPVLFQMLLLSVLDLFISIVPEAGANLTFRVTRNEERNMLVCTLSGENGRCGELVSGFSGFAAVSDLADRLSLSVQPGPGELKILL